MPNVVDSRVCCSCLILSGLSPLFFVSPSFVYPDSVRRYAWSSNHTRPVHISPWRRIFSLRHRRCFRPFSLTLTIIIHDRSCDMGIQENFFWRREDWKSPFTLLFLLPTSRQPCGCPFSTATHLVLLILAFTFLVVGLIFRSPGPVRVRDLRFLPLAFAIFVCTDMRI